MSLFLRLEKDLLARKESSLLRELYSPRGSDFSSNDYFALANNARIIEALKNGLDEEGFGASSSRFIRGERELHTLLECRLATYKNSEKTLLFNSGYAANIGAITSLVKKEDVIFSDELNHASLIDGIRLSGAKKIVFPHKDVQSVRAHLKTLPTSIQSFLVTESLFSMDGDYAPLDRYAELSKEFNCALIIDEAHALGIAGGKGRGLIDQFNIGEHVLCSINGLGKAFATIGAFVAGREIVIETIKQHARTLIYTTAMPPAFLYGIKEALDIIVHGEELRLALKERIKYFSEALVQIGLKEFSDHQTPIFPIMVKDNQKALLIATKLQEAGFDVRAIRPPTVPAGSARLRITTNLNQSFAMISDCVKQLRNYL